jgi:hypothetical protein
MSTKGHRIQKAYEYKTSAALARRAGEVTKPRDEQSGEAAPPILLGGVKSQNIGKMDAGERKASLSVDWLQGTIPFELMESFIFYMTEIVGHGSEIYNHGRMGYQASCEWHPFGITLMWDFDDKNRAIHANRVLLQIGGSGLGCFPAESLYKFFRDLAIKFRFKASRIDLAFDDFKKIIRPTEVYEFAEQRSYQGFRKHKFIGGSGTGGKMTDEGIYFGTRGKNGSGKYARCYGKDIESDGEVDSIRWEVEFSKERANKVFFELAMALNLQDFATKIGLYIGGAIDFVERNGKRCDPIDRLAFWEQILHHIGAATLRNPTPDKSIEKTAKWVETSVAPSLEKMRRAFGDEFYYQWIRDLMQHAELRQVAVDQVRVHHILYGIPEEIPF